MSTALLNRRYANSSINELIGLAIDEGYDSLAYALACKLEAVLTKDADEVSEVSRLEDEVSELEDNVSTLESELARLEGNEELLKAVIQRASASVNGALNLINPDN